MGLANWWGRVRDEIHGGLESEELVASRLAHTPPEFWRPKDWSESRRLRHRRRAFYQAQLKRDRTHHQAMLLVDQKFPPGPFWPYTPERNEELRQAWFDERKMLAIHRFVRLGGELAQYIEYERGPDGIMRAWNPFEEKWCPLTVFGM